MKYTILLLLEINYENFNKPNRFVNNKILKDRNPTIALVLILRLCGRSLTGGRFRQVPG